MVEHVLIVALFTIGYCCTFWEGMIFERLGNIIEFYVGETLWKSLGGCYICACMWVGSLVYAVTWHTSWLDWFVTCVSAMGVNAVVSFISRISEEIQEHEANNNSNVHK